MDACAPLSASSLLPMALRPLLTWVALRRESSVARTLTRSWALPAVLLPPTALSTPRQPLHWALAGCTGTVRASPTGGRGVRDLLCLLPLTRPLLPCSCIS